MATPKPAQTTSDRAQAAIASALRTLEAEGSGVDALDCCIARRAWHQPSPLPSIYPRRARPGDRDRHGQVRSRRAQDRVDFRVDRHACLFRAPRRSEPRRPRNDRQQRCCPGAVVVGRDGGTEKYHRLFAPLRHQADRDDGDRRQRARPKSPMWFSRCRRRARPARTISRRRRPR